VNDAQFAEVNGYVICSCGNIIGKNGRVLTPHINHNGYSEVILTSNGKRYKRRVHRLVALKYVPNPKGLPQVNHIDEDKTNNAASNLNWMTQWDNIHYGTGIERSAKNRTKGV
jgi:hypothetical protein